jgi:uncharacterized protein YfaS (alpha-2-macroglobulin family)
LALPLRGAPLALEFAATVTDDQGGLVSASIPLQIVVTDPLGTVRYDLYRATDRGTLTASLPMAANDAAGDWRISVTELLSGKEGTATLTHVPAATCGILA